MTTQESVETSNPQSYTTYESTTTLISYATRGSSFVSTMVSQSVTSRTTVVNQPNDTDENDDIMSSLRGKPLTFYLIIGGVIFGLMLVAGCLVISFQAALKAKCRRKRRGPASEPESPAQPTKPSDEEDEGGYERIPANVQSFCERATDQRKTPSQSAHAHSSGYINMDTVSLPSRNNSDSLAGTSEKMPNKEKSKTKDAKKKPPTPVEPTDPDRRDTYNLDFTDNTHSARACTKKTKAVPIPVPPVYVNTTTLRRDPGGTVNNQNTERNDSKDERPQVPPRNRENPALSETFGGDFINGGYTTTTLSTFPTSQPKTPSLESRKMNTLPTSKQTTTHAGVICNDMAQSNVCLSDISVPNDFKSVLADSIANRRNKSKDSDNAVSHTSDGMAGDTSKDSVHNPEYTYIGYNEMPKHTEAKTMATLEHEYSEPGQLPRGCHGQYDESDESGYMRVSEDAIYTLPDREESVRLNQPHFHNYVTALTPLLAESMAGGMQVQQTAVSEHSSDCASKDRGSTFEIVLTVHRPKGKRPQLTDYIVR